LPAELLAALPDGHKADLVADALAAKIPTLPRTLDFRTLTRAGFEAIADRLNGRPRQNLGFKTPSQALAEVLR
jgi:hypothetical protein